MTGQCLDIFLFSMITWGLLSDCLNSLKPLASPKFARPLYHRWLSSLWLYPLFWPGDHGEAGWYVLQAKESGARASQDGQVGHRLSGGIVWAATKLGINLSRTGCWLNNFVFNISTSFKKTNCLKLESVVIVMIFFFRSFFQALDVSTFRLASGSSRRLLQICQQTQAFVPREQLDDRVTCHFALPIPPCAEEAQWHVLRGEGNTRKTVTKDIFVQLCKLCNWQEYETKMLTKRPISFLVGRKPSILLAPVVGLGSWVPHWKRCKSSKKPTAAFSLLSSGLSARLWAWMMVLLRPGSSTCSVGSHNDWRFKGLRNGTVFFFGISVLGVAFFWQNPEHPHQHVGDQCHCALCRPVLKGRGYGWVRGSSTGSLVCLRCHRGSCILVEKLTPDFSPFRWCFFCEHFRLEVKLIQVIVAVLRKRPQICPEVAQAMIPDLTFAPARAITERRATGVVKSINTSGGFGFITCPDIACPDGLLI